MTLRIGFLASHGGSNFQAIVDACRDGRLDAVACVLISNNSTCGAMERARRAGIPAYHLSSQTHPEPDALDGAILKTMEAHSVNVVVLAGYMKKIGPKTRSRYRGRILNIHPALLPKFGGQGMYGLQVHAAVIAAGERVSGATVHVIDENYDTGPILAQREVPVLPNETPESLAERILPIEHQLYVETLQKISRGEIKLEGL
jgi:phosphoribosylglycinamide formyltransferase 1